MTFRQEFNPRDFNGYFEMIAHLQTECLKRYHAGFDTTKLRMGQLAHNSELCWLEGDVKDADILAAQRIVQANPGKLYGGSAAPDRVININIQSLGTFYITHASPVALAELKEKIVSTLLTAVNDTQLWGK